MWTICRVILWHHASIPNIIYMVVLYPQKILHESIVTFVIKNTLFFGLYPARLFCPVNSPGNNTGVGCHALLQGLFLPKGSKLGLLHCRQILFFFFLIFYFFLSWRLITLQYCSGFCHTLTWISHGVTCIPHPDPPSPLPLHPIPLGLPSAPGLSTCLMHPAWAGDLFHPR